MRLVLHAGIHRAASSSIQNVLQSLTAPLARRRVLPVTQTMANAPEHRPFKLLRGHKVAEHGLRLVLEKLNAHFDTLSGDYDTVIFSDENMPGLMPGKRQAAFAHTGELAALITGLSADHEVRVVVVVREHVGYLRSVHNFRLARSECGSFADFAGSLDLASLAFAPMLETLAQAARQEHISVHGFETLGNAQAQGVLAVLGELAGAPGLAEAVLPKANTSRSDAEIALFRALNQSGLFLPLRAPRQRLIELVRQIPDFPNCSPEGETRLLELLRGEACRLPFAISSEERLRAAIRLTGIGVGRFVPGVSPAKLRTVLDWTEAWLKDARVREDLELAYTASLWDMFEADREKIAGTWLPQWHELAPPQAR